jgi:hypothetical protein
MKPGHRRRRGVFLVPLWAALLLAAAAGCARYRIGTTLPPHLRTIAVEPFRNETDEPLLETETTRAVLQEIQREGQLKIADRQSAAIRLTGTLVSYRLEPMRYDQNRPESVREYRVVIRAAVEAVERASGRRIVEAVVEGDATLPVQGDLVTARRGAMPEAARQLAHEIVNAVVSAW